MSEKRYGFVGIVVEHPAGATSKPGPRIQGVLSEHAHIIEGRMGLPRLQDGTLSIITLIVRATTDELGALTGRLGSLPGVSVKSALAKIPAATGHGSASGEGQQDGDL